MLAPDIPCRMGPGSDVGRERHDAGLLQRDAGHEVYFQPSAVTYLTKGNLSQSYSMKTVDFFPQQHSQE